jgi:hypothetical protein
MGTFMKKPKPKKIRKVWVLKPATRVKASSKRELLERQKAKECQE